MVYAADRSTLRRAGTSNWSRRELAIEVPDAEQLVQHLARAARDRPTEQQSGMDLGLAVADAVALAVALTALTALPPRPSTPGQAAAGTHTGSSGGTGQPDPQPNDQG